MEIYENIPQSLLIKIIVEAKPFPETYKDINSILIEDIIFAEFYIKNCMNPVPTDKFNCLFLNLCKRGNSKLIRILLKYHSQKLTLCLTRKCINEIIHNKLKNNSEYSMIILMLKPYMNLNIWISMVMPWTIERKKIKWILKILKWGVENSIYNFIDIIKYNSFIAVEDDIICCTLILLNWLSENINYSDFEMHLCEMMHISIKHNSDIHFNFLFDILNDTEMRGSFLLDGINSRNFKFCMKFLESDIDIDKWGLIGLSKIGCLKNRSESDDKLYENLFNVIIDKHNLKSQLYEKKNYILNKIQNKCRVLLDINLLNKLGIETSLLIIRVMDDNNS